MKTVEQVLQLCREKYFDFNVQHFHEKLRGLHGIELSYNRVKTALQTAGLVKPRKKPGSHRKRRPCDQTGGSRRASVPLSRGRGANDPRLRSNAHDPQRTSSMAGKGRHC
jgi:hypothetical protein